MPQQQNQITANAPATNTTAAGQNPPNPGATVNTPTPTAQSSTNTAPSAATNQNPTFWKNVKATCNCIPRGLRWTLGIAFGLVSLYLVVQLFVIPTRYAHQNRVAHLIMPYREGKVVVKEDMEEGLRNGYTKRNEGLLKLAEKNGDAAVEKYAAETAVYEDQQYRLNHPNEPICQSKPFRTETDHTEVWIVNKGCKKGMPVTVYMDPREITAEVKLGPGPDAEDMTGIDPALHGLYGVGEATRVAPFHYKMKGSVILDVPKDYPGGFYVRTKPL